MKIAIVNSFYSSRTPSGENNVVIDQLKVLREAGHEVLLVSRHTDLEESHWSYSLKTAFRVTTGHGNDPTQILKNFNPDIVHLHNLFPNIGTAWVKKWTGPIVISVHNFRAVCSNGILYRDSEICTKCPDKSNIYAVKHSCYRSSRAATIPIALSRKKYQSEVFREANVVIMTSESSQDVLSSLMPFNYKVEVVPNFGDGPGITPRDNLDRIPNGWVALGRMSPEKGLKELIATWPLGKKLTVIGRGELFKEVKELSRGKCVTVIDEMPREALREALPRFVGLVFPSRWLEVAPQVVVEAMRVGLPVAAYYANGVSRLVESSGTGLAYSDRSSLESAVSHIENNLEKFSLSATEYYTANLLPENWLSRMETIYAELMSERK